MGLTAMIRQWRTNLASAHEIEGLGSGERGALARDIGIPEGVLARLAAARAEAGLELAHLMQALSMNVEAVGHRHPAVVRDMSIVCSGCRAAARCRRDLAAGLSAATFDEYCPNADTLKELARETYTV